MDSVVVETTSASSATFLSRILQIALGLFVTTSDLPHHDFGNNSAPANFHCTFNVPCRWFSEGVSAARWKLARGEPDPFLWLASTGTMQRPSEPFVLIELRGQQADRLLSDEIACQRGSATLSFTYWIVGMMHINHESSAAQCGGDRWQTIGI
ncbi:unnamed protein product [Gongylonema pulchrum]|uniref:MAM domain-containing protein n=1 Tax=Gongylonema pulchrum TaxID=637853 RepID=A0A183D801_9BILA|nr:unnamed protein product [Gongylonema pulchrum]